MSTEIVLGRVTSVKILKWRQLSSRCVDYCAEVKLDSGWRYQVEKVSNVVI